MPYGVGSLSDADHLPTIPAASPAASPSSPRSQPPSPTSVAGRRSPESSDSRLRAVAVAVGLLVAGFVASTALGAAAFVVLLLAGGGTDLGAAEFAVLLVAGQLGLGLVGAAYVARWQPVAARIRLPTVRGLAVVLGAVVAPIEELLFRGAIQGRLRRAFGPTGAIVGASARFACVHVLNFTGPVGGGLAFARGSASSRCCGATSTSGPATGSSRSTCTASTTPRCSGSRRSRSRSSGRSRVRARNRGPLPGRRTEGRSPAWTSRACTTGALPADVAREGGRPSSRAGVQRGPTGGRPGTRRVANPERLNATRD